MSEAYQDHLDFFRNKVPGASKAFAWTALWRWTDTTQYLDEVRLFVTPEVLRLVSFNDNPLQGTWRLEHRKILHVEINVHGPHTYTNWVKLQNVPGTSTWIGIKDPDDHGWTVILSELKS